jgi:hypothetical protein
MQRHVDSDQSGEAHGQVFILRQFFKVQALRFEEKPATAINDFELLVFGF